MADNPHGLDPVKHKLGVPLSATVNPYYVPSTYETALFIGDPVVKSGTANTATVANGAEAYVAGNLPEANIGNVAGANTGVMVGRRNQVNDLITKYSPADTEDVVLVCDDPFMVFRAQEDSVGGNIAIASVGLNTNLILTHAGDTTTGISGAELDSSEVATTAGLACKILRKDPVTAAPEANGDWHVLLNDHTEMPGVAGI